jgi:hypothetical protein
MYEKHSPSDPAPIVAAQLRTLVDTLHRLADDIRLPGHAASRVLAEVDGIRLQLEHHLAQLRTIILSEEIPHPRTPLVRG